MSRLTIRTRITLGSTAVAVVLFTIALVLVHSQVAATLRDADATLAASDLASFETEILANPTEGIDTATSGALVYARDPTGAVPLDTLPHEVHEIVDHRDATVEVFTTGSDDDGYVVVGRTVVTEKGTWALWAARSTATSELAMHGLERILVIGGLVLLLGFALASWWLASAALRPVMRLRRAAEVLSRNPDHAALLPVGGARDEIAELATTLNEFLSVVRASMQREKQMISDAAHELRTPIAVLKTQLELARGELAAESSTAQQLASAELSTDRLASLASNLLELSRLEQSFETQQSASSSALAVEFLASVDRARLLALHRSIDVTFELDDDSADHDSSFGLSTASFGRLCDNLVSNAIAAASSVVHFSLTLRSGLELMVHDDGTGMPADFVEHAFERFSRPDASRSVGGSGLGLSLVAAIVNSAHGTATLENSSSGLTVRVSIPKM